jgi:hypothetical protein
MSDLSPISGSADLPQEAAPIVPAKPAPNFDALFSAWLASHVANSPIARSTEAFNHLVNEALPALRQAIQEIV